MPWVIGFILSWIIFFILVDFRQLKRSIFCGLLALSQASLVDWGGTHLGLYRFYDIIINWFGCSAFYKFGPIFTMGIIFAQYVPRKRWLQSVNILVVSLLFAAFEYATVLTHVAEYIHWHIFASLLFDIITFASFTWFTLAYIKKETAY